MEKRGNVWYYNFTLDGVRYRGSTGLTDKTKAQEEEERLKVQLREKHSIQMVWQQTKSKLSSAIDIPVEFEALWSKFSKSGRSGAGAGRLGDYARHLRLFTEWMKEHYPETKKVSNITNVHAIEWWASIRGETGASATKNGKLTTLKMIFAELERQKIVIEDPFRELKKLPLEQVEREAFTIDELRLIGEKAKGWIYSLCLTALSTGLREGDICMLKREYIDLANGWITIPQTLKTGAKVDIPIMPALHRHLSEIMQENIEEEPEYVFPWLATKYQQNPMYISRGIKKFFNEIGLSQTTKQMDGYKQKVSTKDVHSFRHTFVYLAALHGIPFPVVQGIVGHASPAMTKHYMDHARRQDKKQYLMQLPEYLSGTKKAPPQLTAELEREELIELVKTIPLSQVREILSSLRNHLPEAL